jgi:peptide deformylase
MSNKTLPITTHPDPILRQKAAEVKQISSDVELLIGDMVNTMKETKGIGLAAPQVGKNIRLIIVNTKDEPVVLINPKICSKSLKKTKDEEGCLSLPGIFGIVRRHHKVKVKAKNRQGEDIEITGKGMLARVLQHEIDHLDGVLFIDKALKITKGLELLDKM